jgi:sugar lactone lactonase YvrE
MVVDAFGRAYIGNFGYDLHGGEERRAASLVLVDTDGSVRAVADDLWFPNGMVISADGTTLIVAETSAERLSAFRIAEDGSLHDRRLFAFIEGARPDGICLDAEGGVWIASPGGGLVFRVDGDGAVTHRLAAPGGVAQACMLGGPDRRTLFVCSSPSPVEAQAVGERGARILATGVDVPGDGRP